MTESIYINFTYNSPHEDIQNSMGFNSDGSLNIKYTLVTLKNLLLNNVELIDKLLNKVDTIDNINSIGYNHIEIQINNEEILNSLLIDKTLIKQIENIEDENEDENVEYQFSDEETNQTRLNMINNIVNHNDLQIMLDKHSNSESGSDSDEIISDEKNTQSILNKYGNFIKNISDDEELSNYENESDTNSV